MQLSFMRSTRLCQGPLKNWLRDKTSRSGPSKICLLETVLQWKVLPENRTSNETNIIGLKMHQRREKESFVTGQMVFWCYYEVESFAVLSETQANC